MNILVINGSPKGDNSITLQTSLYLQQCFSDHQFSFLNVGSRIKSLEKDFSPAVSAIQSADLLLFSYPVYTFIAPCQLHRFIELLKANHVPLVGKFASQITTSKHFYDVTAHRYIMDNCQDLGMKFIRGLSADMEDLTCDRGQKEAVEFLRHLLWCAEHDIYEPLPSPTLPPQHQPVSVPTVSHSEKTGDVVIVTDCENSNMQLMSMIERFRAVLPLHSRVINLKDFPFRGGCLGCFSCAVDGTCIYTDGFDQFLRNEIQTAQAIVYAFSIKDHSMGSLFKMYDDRNFCNGHRAVTAGKPFGYLISGRYSAEQNLRMIIEGRAEVGGNFLAGVATDEQDPDREIDNLAAVLARALTEGYSQPQNFYGVGGMKIFRDLIYLMQGMMKADHRFYKAHGCYDFPQKKKGTVIKMYLVGMLLSNKKIKSKMGNAMNDGMLMPYKKVLNRNQKQ